MVPHRWGLIGEEGGERPLPLPLLTERPQSLGSHVSKVLILLHGIWPSSHLLSSLYLLVRALGMIPAFPRFIPPLPLILWFSK